MGTSGSVARHLGGLGITLVLLVSGSQVAVGAEILGPTQIIQRFLETARASADREATQELVYVRRAIFEHLKADGSVEKRRSKEHSVTNCAGVIQTQLVRVNDRPPTHTEINADQKDESEGRRQFSRRSSGPDFLDAGLVNRFGYTLEAVESLDGREVYRLAFEPAQAIPASNNSTVSNNRDINRVLELLHGHLWIDAREFELVRMECSLRSPFRLLGGIVGSLSKLDFIVDRRRVAADCWSNVSVLTHIEGRKLISPLRIRAVVEQEEFKLRPLDPAPSPR